jgi:hypothetical protein
MELDATARRTLCPVNKQTAPLPGKPPEKPLQAELPAPQLAVFQFVQAADKGGARTQEKNAGVNAYFTQTRNSARPGEAVQ